MEKRRIVRNSLIQQICGLDQIVCPLKGVTPGENKIFGAAVKIEGSDIRSWRTLDGYLFSGRDFGVKLLCDLLRDFTLDHEHVFQIAIVSFRPDVRVCARVDQLSVYV